MERVFDVTLRRDNRKLLMPVLAADQFEAAQMALTCANHPTGTWKAVSVVESANQTLAREN